jgi:hypothetical protein
MSQSPSITEWTLAAAALLSSVGTLVGIIAQANTNARQIRATVVSANRQAWINALRDDVAEVVSLVEGYHRVQHIAGLIEQVVESERVRADYRRRAELALTRVRLRVNETEQDAKDLVGLLQIAVGAMKMDGPLRENITNAAQRILKAEWLRVKRLE